MYPEDRVLVGVVRRQRDLRLARDEHWYRIPVAHWPRDVDCEIVAFFLSRAFGPLNGGIRYYAEMQGLELAYRRDLLPSESDHRRADDVYYRVALGPLIEKQPPVLNPSRRRFAFITCTWERFSTALVIQDLYPPRPARMESDLNRHDARNSPTES
ncbi:MAG: hypothetical protein U0452_07845 [Anaerolineae bacterium]